MTETTRRAVLAGAGAAGIAVVAGTAGCSAYGDTGPAPAKAQGNGVLIKTTDVPVGGGKIVDQVVVTQPEKGTFKCFSAICTHAGCAVNEVADGKIKCPCHGSAYKVADGSVANGPATRPLPAVAITVTGEDIALTH